MVSRGLAFLSLSLSLSLSFCVTAVELQPNIGELSASLHKIRRQIRRTRPVQSAQRNEVAGERIKVRVAYLDDSNKKIEGGREEDYHWLKYVNEDGSQTVADFLAKVNADRSAGRKIKSLTQFHGGEVINKDDSLADRANPDGVIKVFAVQENVQENVQDLDVTAEIDIQRTPGGRMQKFRRDTKFLRDSHLGDVEEAIRSELKFNLNENDRDRLDDFPLRVAEIGGNNKLRPMSYNREVPLGRLLDFLGSTTDDSTIVWQLQQTSSRPLEVNAAPRGWTNIEDKDAP